MDLDRLVLVATNARIVVRSILCQCVLTNTRRNGEALGGLAEKNFVITALIGFTESCLLLSDMMQRVIGNALLVEDSVHALLVRRDETEKYLTFVDKFVDL